MAPTYGLEIVCEREISGLDTEHDSSEFPLRVRFAIPASRPATIFPIAFIFISVTARGFLLRPVSTRYEYRSSLTRQNKFSNRNTSDLP